MNIIFRWIINALVILIVAALVPGFHIASFYAALIVALVLGIINLTLKPILLVLTLPITIVTLGLFAFIINALMLWLTATIVKGFTIDGFLSALVGALFISIIHFIIHRIESGVRA